MDAQPTCVSTILDARGHIAVDLACANCRYNLRTQPVDGNCPECGHPATETTAGYLPALDREGRVADDLPCVNCGYNLRTLSATGVCPECAVQVALSARGHYLRVASPHWVKRLASGALLLVVALACSVALPVFWMAIAFVGALAAGAGKGISDSMLWLPVGLAVAVGVVCLWLFVRGLLQLTAREPGQKFRGEVFSARRLARYCLLAVAVLTLGAFVSMLATPTWLFGPGATILTSFSVAAVIVYMLLPLALLRYIMALMRRIPRPGLVTFARIEFWGGLIGGVLYVGGHTLMIVATFTTAPTSAPMVLGPPTFGLIHGVAIALSAISGCGMLIVSIAGVVLLILVWRALANAARLAEQNTPLNTA